MKYIVKLSLHINYLYDVIRSNSKNEAMQLTENIKLRLKKYRAYVTIQKNKIKTLIPLVNNKNLKRKRLGSVFFSLNYIYIQTTFNFSLYLITPHMFKHNR